MKLIHHSDDPETLQLPQTTKRFIFVMSLFAGLVGAAILLSLRFSGLLPAEDFSLALIAYETLLAAVLYPIAQILMLKFAIRYVPTRAARSSKR